MKVNAIIERSKDGLYSIYIDNDELSFGLNGQGSSVEEAKEQLMTTYQEIRDMFLEEGKEVPSIEFEYIYDISSFLDFYSGVLSKSGLEKITGVNQKQLWHYAKGIRTPKKETVLKIQEKLHKFGEELSQVRFID